MKRFLIIGFLVISKALLAQPFVIEDDDSLFISSNGLHHVEIQVFQNQVVITVVNQKWLQEFPDVDNSVPRLVSHSVSDASDLADSIRSGWSKYLLMKNWESVDTVNMRRRSAVFDVTIEIWRGCLSTGNKKLIFSRGYFSNVCNLRYTWTDDFKLFHKMLDDLGSSG